MDGTCNECVTCSTHRCRMGTPFPSSQRRVPVSHQPELQGGSVWPIPPGCWLITKLCGLSRLWGNQRWTLSPHHSQVQVRWVTWQQIYSFMCYRSDEEAWCMLSESSQSLWPHWKTEMLTLIKGPMTWLFLLIIIPLLRCWGLLE